MVRPSFAVSTAPRNTVAKPSDAIGGVLMAPLPLSIVGGLFAASVVLALVMDQVKVGLFTHFKMA
jgi:hypothetical protein